MNDTPTPDNGLPPAQTRQHRLVAAVCGLFVLSMVGAAYAAVPLYDLLCRVTGMGGRTQVAGAAPATASEQTVKVRFDANVAPGLSWEFAPEQREVTVKLGETKMVVYKATNLSSQDTWATASYNVAPGIAGSYFAKLQCFCFTKQHLKPGESMDMPVVFFVDPAALEDSDARRVKTITLSYTFFPTEPGDAPTARVEGKAESSRPPS